MKILYIINGLGFSKNMPIGGADKRVSQIGKVLVEKGSEIFVLTTDEGERVLADDDLVATYFKTPPPSFWQPSWFRSVFGRILSYLYLTFRSSASVNDDIKFDIIYPSSDYFFDLIPAILIKRRWPSAKLVGIVHHHLDLPWRRRGNLGQNTLLFISQRLDFLFFKLFNLVFVPGNTEGGLIKGVLGKYIGENKISVFKNGIEYKIISDPAEVDKRVDACFLGGFRQSKGVLDIVPVWREVVKALPEAKILVIGGGTSANESTVKEMVEKAKLSKNVTFAGVLPGESLFSFVKACRIFVSLSYEEGWGIALLEALSCGLPAIVYDLPAYGIFSSAVMKVPLGDTKMMAQAITKILSDPNQIDRYRVLGRELSENFDWDIAANEEMRALERVANA